MRRTLAAARSNRRATSLSSRPPPRSNQLRTIRSVVGLEELHFQRHLLKGWLAAQFLLQPPLHAGLAVDRLYHVYRDPDRARLVGDRPADGLPDPPCRVGAELEAQCMVELVDCPQQAEVAFLDQVEEVEAAADVALGHAHHQAQVALRQPVMRQPSLCDGQTPARPCGLVPGRSSRRRAGRQTLPVPPRP